MSNTPLWSDLGHGFSTSHVYNGVLSGIPCIISQNLRNVAPCSGLVKKSAYIFPVGQYLSDKSLFSIGSLIKENLTQMCCVCFVLNSFRFFSVIISLILSWWNSRSSTAYPCLSMNYLDYSNCGKALSDTTLLDSVELLPFIFWFFNSSVIDPNPMDIIGPVFPLQSGCAAKGALTHHLMTLRMSALSNIGRCRVILMYVSTLTRFPHSSFSGYLTWINRKAISKLISFLALDVINSSCATVWCNYITW